MRAVRGDQRGNQRGEQGRTFSDFVGLHWGKILIALLWGSRLLECNLQTREIIADADSQEIESDLFHIQNVSQLQKYRNMDKISEQRIEQLHPKIRTAVRAFLEDAKKQGITLRITSGYRSVTEQDRLFAQGRTASGRKVTNARGGQSWHNYGLAIDVVQMVGQTPIWKADWERIGKIGEAHGFEWGGRWKFVDKPHFQMRFGLTIAQAQARRKGNWDKFIEI